jgi:hypothetical protein
MTMYRYSVMTSSTSGDGAASEVAWIGWVDDDKEPRSAVIGRYLQTKSRQGVTGELFGKISPTQPAATSPKALSRVQSRLLDACPEHDPDVWSLMTYSDYWVVTFLVG